MKKNPKDFILLILFYLNLAIYVGGIAYWHWADHEPMWVMANDFQTGSYETIIQKYSQRYGLDWRFVSSMIETESSFNSNAVSPSGAVGLMQVMPKVASMEGVTDINNPEENIRIGLKHFKRYFDVLKGETLDDTLKINLAAYNAGIAHIQDARKLATYLNMNPKEWKSLETTLPLLEQTEFHPFVDYGYCQGSAVVSYTNKVFKKYQNYRKTHPDYSLETKEL